jgi:TonB-dependent SusC/RagA subfamily outer membrane receptor
MVKQLAVGATMFVAACSTHSVPASVGNDPVNTGYGTQDRREIGGAVSSISRDDIKQQNPRSLADLIQSRVPGAQIVNTRDGFAIRLRGLTSIYGSNAALIVVDGMPLSEMSAASALATMRPEDVAQIDVLKDGMAAIYGVRGSNGVVVITTRRR